MNVKYVVILCVGDGDDDSSHDRTAIEDSGKKETASVDRIRPV